MEICPWPSSWVWQMFWVMGDVWMGRAPRAGFSAANQRPGLPKLTNEKLLPPAVAWFLYLEALQGPGHYYTWLIANTSTHGHNPESSGIWGINNVFLLYILFIEKYLDKNVSAQRMMMIMLWEVRTWWSGDYSLVLFRIMNPMERGPGVIISLLHPHNTTIKCPYELAFHNFSWSPISSEWLATWPPIV